MAGVPETDRAWLNVRHVVSESRRARARKALEKEAGVYTVASIEVSSGGGVSISIADGIDSFEGLTLLQEAIQTAINESASPPESDVTVD